MFKLGQEVDLMSNYPRSFRDVEGRENQKTESDRRVARRFDQEFFDGSRNTGYGGFSYDPRFWEPVVPVFTRHFGLEPGMRVLDIGCAKGFMAYDLARLIPGLQVYGLDVSEYAIRNSKPEVRNCLQVADARRLPFADGAFDVVFSITTLHNLVRDDLAEALREIERVGKGRSFITVDAYENERERVRMNAWNLTALTVMHVKEWRDFFAAVGYGGDFYWFRP